MFFSVWNSHWQISLLDNKDFIKDHLRFKINFIFNLSNERGNPRYMRTFLLLYQKNKVN